MKNLLIIFLTVSLIFSVTLVSSAASVTTTMGGDVYIEYRSSNDYGGGGVDLNDPAFKKGNDQRYQAWGEIKAINQVGDTWTQIDAKIDCWTDYVQNGIYYAFGINKLGGLVDVSFNTKDEGTTNIGQKSMPDLMDDYKADPLFASWIKKSSPYVH